MDLCIEKILVFFPQTITIRHPNNSLPRFAKLKLMKLEGRVTQILFLALLAAALYVTGPWIIEQLGGIFKNVGNRHLDDIENYDPTGGK